MTVSRSKLNFLFSALLASAASISLMDVAQAGVNKEQALVDHATLAVQDIFTDIPKNSKLYERLRDARAVMVCPSIVRMSLVFGGSGGDCVLLSRDARGSWSSPAFYGVSDGSFGLQLGVQNSKMMLFIMTEHSLRALIDSQFTMGASASATAASSSSDADSGASGSKIEIYTIQKSSGLFAGAALKGSKLKINSKANYRYYQQAVGPEDILITMRVNNPSADPLKRMLINLSSRTVQRTRNRTTYSNDRNLQDQDRPIELAPENSGDNQVKGVKSESLPPIQHKRR